MQRDERAFPVAVWRAIRTINFVSRFETSGTLVRSPAREDNPESQPGSLGGGLMVVLRHRCLYMHVYVYIYTYTFIYISLMVQPH